MGALESFRQERERMLLFLQGSLEPWKRSCSISFFFLILCFCFLGIALYRLQPTVLPALEGEGVALQGTCTTGTNQPGVGRVKGGRFCIWLTGKASWGKWLLRRASENGEQISVDMYEREWDRLLSQAEGSLSA